MNYCSNGNCFPFFSLTLAEKFAYLQVAPLMWAPQVGNSPVTMDLEGSRTYLLSPEFRFIASNCI